MKGETIPINKIKDLLAAGKKVSIKTKGGKYVPVGSFYEKGILPTYQTTLENGNKIKTSAHHLFYSNAGWVPQNQLSLDHKLLCEDGTFSKVVESVFVGKYPIVDLSVCQDDFDDQCYIGNGILNHNSGKSLIMAHTLANTQKKGGLAVYIDTENALSDEFLTAIGVDLKNMLYLPLETVEDIFESVEKIIETVRSSSKDRLVTIVVDSVSAATTRIEQGADYDKDGWATAKAILMSKAMRKITNTIGKQKVLLLFASQLREKMGVMFGDKLTTSGGKALGFHASVRVRLKSVGKIKTGKGATEQTIGVKTEASIIKNRVGPPFRKAGFDIYFNSGIDDIDSWLDSLVDYGVIKQSGSYYTLINEDTGEELRFQSKEWRALLERADVHEFCYKKLCDIYVMKYRSQDLVDKDSIVIEEEQEY